LFLYYRLCLRLCRSDQSPYSSTVIKMANQTFDIIITSFNALKYLKKCLHSIQKYTKGFDYRIVVVDNGSQDGSKRYLRQLKGINFVSFKRNLGPARAFNRGVRVSSGQFIVRIDDDSQVTPGWLGSLYETFNYGNKIGIVGPKTVFKNGVISCANELIKYVGVYSSGEIDRGQRDYIRYCDMVAGSGMLLKRSLIDDVGYFDERLKCYVDVDFCLRTRMAGYKIVYNGKAKIIHHLLFRYKNVLKQQDYLFRRKWEKIKDLAFNDSHPADKYNTLGLDCLIDGDCKRAASFLKKAQGLDRRAGLTFFMAVALWGMKRKKEALRILKAMAKRNPLDYGVKHFLALIYLRQKGNSELFKLIKQASRLKKFGNFQRSLNEAVYKIAVSS